MLFRSQATAGYAQYGVDLTPSLKLKANVRYEKNSIIYDGASQGLNDVWEKIFLPPIHFDIDHSMLGYRASLHYLKDGVQFADDKGSELPIANNMRGDFAVFIDERITDAKKYYNKVIESVDLNNPAESWLYGSTLTSKIALQMMDGDIDKAFEDAFFLLEISEKSNIPKDKENALTMIWIIAGLKENWDIVDMALDELINFYNNQPVISASYDKEIFDNILVFYELSILTKLEKDEFVDAANYFDYYGGLTDKLEGKTIPVNKGVIDYTVLEPYGVSAHIIPWNYPISMLGRSLACSFATGNSTVVKTPEDRKSVV